jgi:hypothetical protein
MLTLIVLGTLLIFLNGLLQFIATFPDTTLRSSLKPYYNSGTLLETELNGLTVRLDQFAILMIPSSKLAFQITTAIVAVVAALFCGFTGYLLTFHIYLCKSTCSHVCIWNVAFFHRLSRLVNLRFCGSTATTKNDRGSNSSIQCIGQST